jgi:anion-transporting  ArsA/GET3 family ATPase
MPKYNIDKLEKFYLDAEQADHELFSEQRSNLLLVTGEHYNRKRSRYWNRLRTSKDLTIEQRIRLTKNHIQRIVKVLVNNLVTNAPGVQIVPNNDKEIQDQKSAELNQAVWQHCKDKQKMRMKIMQWANDFIGVGEVAVKLSFDPNAGELVGYSPKVDEMGEPIVGEDGQMQAGEPIFSGDIKFERVFGFNLLLPPECKSFEDSHMVMIRKMVAIDDLKAQFGDTPEKAEKIQKSSDETFQVFENSSSTYVQSKDQALVIEHYVRPCHDYPNGYYFIRTKHVILAEGELPFGIFPIIYSGYDEVQTKCRHRSIIKQLRPYQVEINRAASKMAEHQITLGDDKLLYQSGAKLAHGVTLPGVRGISYTGMKPEILPGRAGQQYLEYMNAQIAEMYNVAGVAEDREQKDLGQSDAYAVLYRSMREKKKFSLYSEKFEQFLIQVVETYLKLAKQYFNESMLIPAVGRHEYINISEFKNSEPLAYQITVEPMSDDIETMMGKQLVMNHALQYVGGQLDKEDIGKVMRNMPFSNLDASFDDLTIDYDMATNMILSLDRGDMPKPSKYDDHIYMVKRLTHRVRQSDFQLLPPPVQESYNQMIQYYEQLEMQRQQELLMAQSKFIPSGGPRVKVDFYVQSPSNPNRTERATLPMESVDWLIKKLAQQGSSQESFQQLNPGAQHEIAQQFNQQMQQQAMGPQAGVPAQALPAGQPGGI